MKTAVVILNWNGKGFLQRYLPGVVASLSSDPDSCVVVADNGSTDGSLELLKQDFPGVTIVPFKKNHGFAGGYNRAIKAVAKDIGAEYCLLLNSDVDVPPGWLDVLVQWMDLHPECGICGPKLHQIGDRDMFEYAGAAGGYIDRYGYPFCRGRVMGTVQKDEGQWDVPAEVLWVSGAALMIRTSLFLEMGGFDEDFFAHMEEIDLCWRARLKGWRVCIVPRSVVYHVGGGSLPQDSPRKLQLNYRNNLLMLEHNLPLTLALEFIFNYHEAGTDPDEGPDFFEVCADIFREESRKYRKEIIDTAAFYGVYKARLRIFGRMLLDGASAIVYLLTFHPARFKAVWTAHRQYRMLRKGHRLSLKKVASFLSKAMNDESLKVARAVLADAQDCDNLGSGRFRVKGIWNKWMVWQYISQKSDIFTNIKERIL